MDRILEEKLAHLAEDELLLQAIYEVFNKQIEDNKPSVDTNDNNVKIGEKYRAYEKAKDILTKTLIDIRNYKVNISNNKRFNKAR